MAISRGDKGGDLRAAFQYEVRPDVYVARVWWTAALVGIGYAAMLMYRNGSVVAEVVVPLAGWHARNPDGAMYMEVWATVVANALQVAFGFWGAWLVLVGAGRLVVNRRLVRAAFGLGIAFGVVAVAAPFAVALAAQACIAKWPGLAG